MEVQIVRKENSILFTVSDAGQPFNPLEQPEPDLSLTAEQRTPGGLGILLLKKLARNVRYLRKDEYNILMLEFNAQ